MMNVSLSDKITIPTADEQAMVAALLNKEQAAFEELYRCYAAALMGIVHRIVKFDEEAEDVLQDCFLKIYHNIAQFDTTKGRLYTWMARLARNQAIDYIRKPSVIRNNSHENLTDTLDDINLNYQVADLTDTIGVKNLAAGLDLPYKEILDLLYFQGFTQSEVAEALNIPLGTVKTRARTAIIKLREFFLIN